MTTKRLLNWSAIAASTVCVGLGTSAVQAQATPQNYLDAIENYAGGQYPGVTAEPATRELQLLEQIEAYSTSASDLGQAASAGQFSDVNPGDWAYQALDDLVRRYDCLKGYPNGTFSGNRALTRYEFAAGLNACLQQIERLVAETTANFVTQDDLEKIQRLMQDFEAELAALGERVDALESRTAFLEDNQFSTTTKLGGEVIFGLSQMFTNSDPVNLAFLTNNGQDAIATIDNNDTNNVFGYRARLTFNTSFTGQDLLVTRLATGNLTALTANSLNLATTAVGGDTTQTFNVGANNNTVAVDWLAYYFPLSDAQGYVAANGGIWSDFVPTLNPYFEDFDGGNGALSTFASENPIYRIGGGAGAGVSWDFGGPRLSLGYLAGQANTSNRGLLSGDYALLAQVDAEITSGLQVGLTYVHGYHPTNTNIFDAGSTGTTGVVGTASATLTAGPSITNSYGAQLAWQPNDDISFSSFISYTDLRETSFGSTFDGEVWTYGFGLAFPDLGQEGNLLGLFVGVQPYLGSFDTVGTTIRRKTTPYHVEAFYKHKISDNISITPGIIWLSSPNQVRESAIVGTIRTTFTF